MKKQLGKRVATRGKHSGGEGEGDPSVSPAGQGRSLERAEACAVASTALRRGFYHPLLPAEMPAGELACCCGAALQATHPGCWD